MNKGEVCGKNMQRTFAHTACFDFPVGSLSICAQDGIWFEDELVFFSSHIERTNNIGIDHFRVYEKTIQVKQNIFYVSNHGAGEKASNGS